MGTLARLDKLDFQLFLLSEHHQLSDSEAMLILTSLITTTKAFRTLNDLVSYALVTR
jgi:hypothetical protein